MSAHVVSKTHIDLLVQAAIAGPTDGVNWRRPGEPCFRWQHDGVLYQLDPHADDLVDRVVTPSQFGQRLVSECVRSVHDRYPDDNPDTGDLPGPIDAYYMGPYVFEPVVASAMREIRIGMPSAIVAPATTAEIAAQVNYYEYQSCEHDEWGASEAFAICRALKDNLLRSLPGYEAAPWGWDLRSAS